MEITSLRPFIESNSVVGGKRVALDDPELFKYPVAYSRAGRLVPHGEKSRSRIILRAAHILRFLGAPHWRISRNTAARVPQARIEELSDKHPIFDAFFKGPSACWRASSAGVPSLWHL